jgi:hypothetical protein
MEALSLTHRSDPETSPNQTAAGSPGNGTGTNPSMLSYRREEDLG